MRRKQAAKNRRGGLSLLEMMAATAIMATVTAVGRRGDALGLRRVERPGSRHRRVGKRLRRASALCHANAAGDGRHRDHRLRQHPGSLSFTTSTGATCTWARNASSDVYFNNGTSNQLLAKSINSLTFTGYKADGVTATTTVADIQVVQCQVQITLPRGAGVTRTLTTRAWIRSW